MSKRARIVDRLEYWMPDADLDDPRGRRPQETPALPARRPMPADPSVEDRRPEPVDGSSGPR